MAEQAEEAKRCSRCGASKPRAAFADNRSMRDGLQEHCRACQAEHYRRRQEAGGLTVRARVPVPRGSERCPKCAEVKPHSEWVHDKGSSDGWASHCRDCRARRHRESCFQRKCGITEAERDAMIEAQGGVCVICLSPRPEHVDHCHETGRVRGVLCFSCYAALGQLKDRPAAMRRAADYVEGNSWKPTLVAPGVYQLPS